MSRYFKKITLDEFKEKLKPMISNEEFPYEGIPDAVSKEWKVTSDWENFECGKDYNTEELKEGKVQGFSNYPCGLRMLSNGMPVLFINAGGDWEYPICFIIYWDGEKLRGYTPTKGNVFDRKEKEAFGNIEYDNDEAYKIAKALLKEASGWMDVKDQLKQLEEDYKDDAMTFINEIMNISSETAIIDDIMNRIVEKT